MKTTTNQRFELRESHYLPVFFFAVNDSGLCINCMNLHTPMHAIHEERSAVVLSEGSRIGCGKQSFLAIIRPIQSNVKSIAASCRILSRLSTDLLEQSLQSCRRKLASHYSIVTVKNSDEIACWTTWENWHSRLCRFVIWIRTRNRGSENYYALTVADLFQRLMDNE